MANKKFAIVIIIIILSIIIIVDIVHPQQHKIHKTLMLRHSATGNTYNIGNKLSHFFFEMGTCAPKLYGGQCPEKWKNSLWHRLMKQYKPLKTCVPYIASLRSNNSYHTWAEHLFFWNIMQPNIRNIINNVLIPTTLPKNHSTTIFIHFRCGDVPFIRSNRYVIPKMTFINSAIENILLIQPDITHIVFVTGFRPEKASSCNQTECISWLNNAYMNTLKQQFAVTIQSTTADEDFATLVTAKYLVASMPSSFVWFAGLACDGYVVYPGDSKNCIMHSRWVWLE